MNGSREEELGGEWEQGRGVRGEWEQGRGVRR